MSYTFKNTTFMIWQSCVWPWCEKSGATSTKCRWTHNACLQLYWCTLCHSSVNTKNLKTVADPPSPTPLTQSKNKTAQADFQKEARPKEDREILWSALCKQLREARARNPGGEIRNKRGYPVILSSSPARQHKQHALEKWNKSRVLCR